MRVNKFEIPIVNVQVHKKWSFGILQDWDFELWNISK